MKQNKTLSAQHCFEDVLDQCETVVIGEWTFGDLY